MAYNVKQRDEFFHAKSMEVAKIKADAIREAVSCTRLTTYPHLCEVEGLLAFADKLEGKG